MRARERIDKSTPSLCSTLYHSFQLGVQISYTHRDSQTHRRNWRSCQTVCSNISLTHSPFNGAAQATNTTVATNTVQMRYYFFSGFAGLAQVNALARDQIASNSAICEQHFWSAPWLLLLLPPSQRQYRRSISSNSSNAQRQQ